MVMKTFLLLFLSSCEPEQCFEREDFYLSTEKHEYNILPKAGSWLGHTHSDDAKTKISDAAKKIDHSGRFKPGQQRPEGSGRLSQQIEVTDKNNNQTTTYESIREAARALNINQTVIIKYFSRNQTKPYKARYTFKKV